MFTRLAGQGIKNVQPIFKADMLIYRSKANLGPVYMGSDPFGSDPLFEGRLHGIGSRIVGVYTRSDPFGFYELLAAF